uniref:Integrase catalytic domain-containing protein n=1 Tax=Fagus sylvatica TaxID=28930 RepID=A0A2N9H092_FAGSY
MAEVFVGRFITNSRRSKGLDTLMMIRLGSNELIKDYSARFWETYNDIDDCGEDTALQAFKLGLPPKEDGGNTNAMLPEAPMQPSSSRSQGQTGQASKASSVPTSYTPPSFKAFQTVFKEPIHRILDKIKGESFFVWPPKLVSDPAARNHNLYCFYHRDRGHLTENCHKYKTHLEQLVTARHLSDYVDPNLVGNKARGTIANRSGTSGPTPADGVLESWIMPIFCRHLVREILVPPPIKLSNEDLADVQMLHNDPLVITFRFGDYDVKRVLVDQGNFAEVMYKGLYEKLGLKEADLENFSSLVFGFSGESTIPLGKTTLPVLTGPISLQTEFIVIHGSSPYNAIVGRDWLHRMKAVPSTLHQKLQFPTEDRIMEIPIAVMGEITAEKDPEKIYFDPSEPEFFFLIGKNLSLVDREELITLLIEFREVFAWSVYEVPGVSPDLACHSLNISSEAKPVSQKRRKLAFKRDEIVAKEVDRSGKFLGHMVSYNGVEANPDQISALLNLEPPKDAKQVQRLTGMIAALGRFISQSVEKCCPFFRLLGKKRKFLWDEDCLAAFQRIKTYLSSPPCLSIPCSGEPLFLYLAISEHAVSAVLVRETHEGQKPVFFVSKTMNETESRYLPLEKAVLALIQATKKLPHYFQASTVTVLTDLPLKVLLHSSDFSGRVTRWGVHLGSLGVEYKPRTSIKGQVLADFVAKFQGKGESSEPTNTSSSHIEELVVNHISGEYLAQDEWMLSYFSIVKSLLSKFEFVQVEQIRREHNSHVDILAKLATALETDLYRTVTVEVLSNPSTLIDTVDGICSTSSIASWMDPLIAYLWDDCLPEDPKMASTIKRKAPSYWLSKEGNLYRQSFSGPYLLKCDKCQRFAPKIHQPARELNPLSSPWPFAQWGLDIVGPLPRASGNKKFLIVATDYFTKWIEAEPLSHIREVDTKRFLWKNVITRFGIPWAIISDNGTQFEGKLFKGFCLELDIRNFFSSPACPQANGQAETIRRRSIGKTPFALAYGVEAVIPLEVGLPTTRTTEFDVKENEENLRKDLNLLEERRDMAIIRLASYQHQMKRGYEKNIRPRSFQVGDLVLRKVVANTRNPNDGKPGPNWEGPYKVTSFVGVGAYRLIDMDGKSVPRPWNICNLKKYFF